MANKVLKGISFPGLANTYTVPEAVAVETAEGCIEIQSYISDTIETEITNLDTTLTKEGYAADAKAVGDAINSLDTTIAVDENFDGNIEIRSYLPEQDYLQLDKSLTVEGAAADAKASGDAINQLSSEKADLTHVNKVGAPHNYLDNSDFRNPVNQREQTGYTASGYTIDRWYASAWNGNVAVTVESGGLRLSGGTADTANSCYIEQRLDATKLRGKTLTFAIKNSEFIAQFDDKINVFCDRNRIEKGTIVSGGIDLVVFTVPENAELITISVGGSASYGGKGIINALLEWAALYEGEYTAETLPEYKPKGYGAELAECLRYYQKDVRMNALHAADSYFAVSYMHRMRIAPTVTPQRFDFYGKGSLKDFTGCEFGVNNSQLQYAYLPTVISYSLWTSGFKGALTVDLSADL